VVLVHAIEQLTYDVSDTLWVVDHYQALRQIADRLMGNLSKRLARQGVRAHTVMLRGTPALRIIEEAKKRRADLIIMGTHGRTGLEHLLLGSVAERVVRLSPCPVLTVRIAAPRRKGRRHGRPAPLI